MWSTCCRARLQSPVHTAPIWAIPSIQLKPDLLWWTKICKSKQILCCWCFLVWDLHTTARATLCTSGRSLESPRRNLRNQPKPEPTSTPVQQTESRKNQGGIRRKSKQPSLPSGRCLRVWQRLFQPLQQWPSQWPPSANMAMDALSMAVAVAEVALAIVAMYLVAIATAITRLQSPWRWLQRPVRWWSSGLSRRLRWLLQEMQWPLRRLQMLFWFRDHFAPIRLHNSVPMQLHWVRCVVVNRLGSTHAHKLSVFKCELISRPSTLNLEPKKHECHGYHCRRSCHSWKFVVLVIPTTPIFLIIPIILGRWTKWFGDGFPRDVTWFDLIWSDLICLTFNECDWTESNLILRSGIWYAVMQFHGLIYWMIDSLIGWFDWFRLDCSMLFMFRFRLRFCFWLHFVFDFVSWSMKWRTLLDLSGQRCNLLSSSRNRCLFFLSLPDTKRRWNRKQNREPMWKQKQSEGKNESKNKTKEKRKPNWKQKRRQGSRQIHNSKHKSK